MAIEDKAMEKRITFAGSTNGHGDIHSNGNGPKFRSRLNSKVVVVDRKKYVEPPDGGWGWVIVLAVWIDNVLVLGMLKSMGVLYPEFKAEFSEYDSATVSWINSISLSMRATAAPLSAALSNRFEERRVVAVGAVFVVIGLIISQFAQSPYFLYASLGCVTGFGFALASLPALTMIGRYFKVRRSLANGLSRSGGGATFFLAPLIQYLVVQYGWQGCLLIIGGIELHLFVCALLLRPLRLKEELKFDSGSTMRRHSVRKSSMLPESNGNDKNQNENWYRRKLSEKDRVRALQKEIEQKVQSSGVTESLIVEHFPHIEPVYQPANKKTLTFGLLKDPLWLILTANLVLTQFGYSMTLVHTVARAKKMGIGEYESVFLISYIGITEVTAQLSSGFMADRINFRKINLHKVYIAIMAAATIISLFVKSYLGMTIYCILFGLGSGSWQGNILPVTVDTLGVANLRSAYGFCLFFSGCLGQMLGPPIGGALYDSTGSYHWSFVVASICFITASSLLWFEIPASKYVKKKAENESRKDLEKANQDEIDHLYKEMEDVTDSRNFVA
ncbi:monocarboxylate transporter 5-like isoform X1 [Styela clava]